MKKIILLGSLSLSFFAYANIECDIENYQDFIHRLGVHDCVLEEADLVGVDLREADLRRADLENTNFSRANLQQADLSGADLENTNFSNANVQRAKVTQEQADYLTEQGLSGFVVVE